MPISIVFETHSWSEDNDRGIVTGWLPGRLSKRGRRLARQLGDRRRDDGICAVFTSDLHRCAETAEIAFAQTAMPVLADWRLRECDHGALNGAPVEVVRPRIRHHLKTPYPDGESWEQAVDRVAGFLADLPLRWAGRRVLVIGHVATRWALDIHLGGRDLADLATTEFGWQEGREYEL
jgi:broad specificity phosphatase PhoE